MIFRTYLCKNKMPYGYLNSVITQSPMGPKNILCPKINRNDWLSKKIK